MPAADLSPSLVEVEIGGHRFNCAVAAAATDGFSDWIRSGAGTEAPVHWAQRLVQPEWCVLDLGANLGTFSFPIAHDCRQVVAVEALPANYVLLTVAAASNDVPVVPVHAAVWDRHATISMSGHSAWAQAVDHAEGHIPGLRVRDLVDAYADGEIDLVKIDIEGAEAAVMPDVLALAERRDRFAIIYEANQALSTDDVRGLHRSVAEAGFALWYLDPMSLRAMPVDLDVPQFVLNCDVLALKGEAATELPSSGWSVDELAERMAWEVEQNGTDACRWYARAVLEQLPRDVAEHPAVVAALGAEDIDDAAGREVSRYRRLIGG